MNSYSLMPLLWFIAIIVMIPLALWMLKRTPLGATATQGVMRNIASLPISQNQRLMTVEVGQGDDRRWLVLGVSAGSITTLHTMPPQADLPPSTSANQIPAFAQVLARLRKPGGRA